MLIPLKETRSRLNFQIFDAARTCNPPLQETLLFMKLSALFVRPEPSNCIDKKPGKTKTKVERRKDRQTYADCWPLLDLLSQTWTCPTCIRAETKLPFTHARDIKDRVSDIAVEIHVKLIGCSTTNWIDEMSGSSVRA